MLPFIRKISHVPPNQSPELTRLKEIKAAEKYFMTWWHATAAFGLYWAMKDEAWLPWYLGGSHEGRFEYGFFNMPFTPMSRKCYIIGLIILGKPL